MTNRWFIGCVVWGLGLLALPGWAAEPAACEPVNRVHFEDLKGWRQRVLQARDQDVLAQELGSIGFDTKHLDCWGKGRIVSVDILPATFGEKTGADRLIRLEARNCSVKSDFVVLRARPEGRWCTAVGDVFKGGSNTCDYEPLQVRLVHLTDPRRHTLKLFSSTGSTATLDSGEKGCDIQRYFSFYDVRDNNLVPVLGLDADADAGPIRLSGGFPRTVHTQEEGREVVYRLRAGRTEYERVWPAEPESSPP